VSLLINCRVIVEDHPSQADSWVLHQTHVRVHVCVLWGLLPRNYVCAYAWCAQGEVLSGFAGVNKCTLLAATVHQSMGLSLCVGDGFCVMKVGTVGRVLAGSQPDTGDDDTRNCVLHAALVQVRPIDGSDARFEVLTAEQLNPVEGQVEWHRCGLLPMDLRQFHEQGHGSWACLNNKSADALSRHSVQSQSPGDGRWAIRAHSTLPVVCAEVRA